MKKTESKSALKVPHYSRSPYSNKPYTTQSLGLNNKIRQIDKYAFKKRESSQKDNLILASIPKGKQMLNSNDSTSSLKQNQNAPYSLRQIDLDKAMEKYKNFEELHTFEDGLLTKRKQLGHSSSSDYFQTMPHIVKLKTTNKFNVFFKNDSKVNIFTDDKAGFTSPISAFSTIANNKSIYSMITSNCNLVKSDSLVSIEEKIEKYKDYIEYQKSKVMANPVYVSSIKDANKSSTALKQIDSNLNKKNKSKISLLSPEDETVEEDHAGSRVETATNHHSKNANGYNSILPSVNNKISLFAYFYYPKNDFPEGRESSTLCFNLNYAYLFGGVDCQMKNHIWEFNPDSMEWRMLKSTNTPSFSQRHSHTCISYNNKLFIYGGKAKSNSYVMFPDLEVYDLSTNLWSMPSSGSGMVKPRKNHVCCQIGNQMIVHGGITEEGIYLSDTFSLNLETSKFMPLMVVDNGLMPERAWHCSSVLAPIDIIYSVKNHLYSYENSKRKMNYQPGFYIFGGKMNDQQLTNEVWLLPIGRKPCEWLKIPTEGQPPSPRYMATMNFYEEANLLIIHGGRSISSVNDEMTLGDTYVLHMQRYQWNLVDFSFPNEFYRTFPRFGHTSFLYTDKLVIFGGSNDYNMIGSSFFIVNLNKNKNNSLSNYQHTVRSYMSLGRLGKEKLENFNKGKRRISMVNVVSLPFIK